MKENFEIVHLEIPIIDTLNNLTPNNAQKHRTFDVDSLFWSITRLFLLYKRIYENVEKYSEDKSVHNVVREYLASDTENFIIRYRILLNNIAYIIRQILPDYPGLKAPAGKTHPLNKEMSIRTLKKSVLNSKEDKLVDLKKIFSDNESWLNESLDNREKIIHYKSMVIIFNTSPVSFAVVDAAGTYPKEKNNHGGYKVVTRPIMPFINQQSTLLWNFINGDLNNWFTTYAKKNNLPYTKKLTGCKIYCHGIEIFAKKNGINK